jgi:hypothetical protein
MQTVQKTEAARQNLIATSGYELKKKTEMPRKES